MKTTTVYDLELQAWWDQTLMYSDHFFDTTADISTRNEGEEMLQLYVELQSIRLSYEIQHYPQRVSEIRQHLLNSMTEVVLSFQAYFSGKRDVARFYMQTAEVELMNLQHKADDMGLPRLADELMVH